MAGTGLALIAAALYGWRSPAAAPLAAISALVFASGLVGYAVRHARFVGSLGRADRALAAGDLVAARDILAPLLDRFPALPVVTRPAGRLLYAAGDPLSAATLLERAARSFRRDPEVVVTLVASYAALNKAGDARRAAAALPGDPDVRLALAWAELVALGGDRGRGATLAAQLPRDTPPRAAMAAVLRAVAAALRGDRAGTRAELRVAAELDGALVAAERAFLGYLGGVALGLIGATDDARATFSAAMAAAPGTIGEALARRERAHLPASEGLDQPDQPDQPDQSDRPAPSPGSSSGQSPSD